MTDNERSGGGGNSGSNVAVADAGNSPRPTNAVPASESVKAAVAPTTPAATPVAEHVEVHQPVPSHRRAVGIAIAVLVLGAALYFGVPIVQRALNTVSTDDAYVNGHVTFVAARVPGQVMDVLVDDNYRVRGPGPGRPKGDVLVRLDPTPYQVIVDQKRAAYDLANSNLTVTRDSVRAMIATTRAARFKMDHAVEDVNNQIALLKANVAARRNRPSQADAGR